jgi:hypothetical protein
VAALLHAGYVLLLGLSQPLLDQHSFRQTQTALSAYWLLQGGPWLAYETPVLGNPWSIPFEFPLYQWTVALVARSGISLDAAGRIVSFSFYVGTLWPLSLMFRATGISRVAYLSTAILFMTAPLYLYWSRTFLMESCALFFACLALALLTSYLQKPTIWLGAGAAAAGTVATLAKATTFPAFAFVGGFLAVLTLFGKTRRQSVPAFLVASALILLLPFALGYAWVYYTDQIKSANEFGKLLTSGGLTSWNFGTLQQKLSSTLWNDTLLVRTLPDLFGSAFLVAGLAAGAALSRPQLAVASLLAIAGFIVAFLIFTNVHIVHNYYQYANGIFAIAAVGIGLTGIAQGIGDRANLLIVPLLGVIVASQLNYFNEVFKTTIVRDVSTNRLLEAALIAKEHTRPENSIIVFGNDWDSTIPYYSQRKAIAVPFWIPPPLLSRLVASPQTFLGDRTLGAIVFCRDALAGYKDNATAIEKFVSGRALMGQAKDCQVLAP